MCATETSPTGSYQMPSATVDKCNECGEEVKIVGKGLCSPCYQRQRRKDLAQKESSPSATDNEITSVPDTDHPQETQQMKSGKSSKPTSAVGVDDTADVCFTIPKGYPTPLDEIYIHFFERDKELLQSLKHAAYVNRRDLQNEILFRLEQFYDIQTHQE